MLISGQYLMVIPLSRIQDKRLVKELAPIHLKDTFIIQQSDLFKGLRISS